MCTGLNVRFLLRIAGGLYGVLHGVEATKKGLKAESPILGYPRVYTYFLHIAQPVLVMLLPVLMAERYRTRAGCRGLTFLMRFDYLIR